MAKLILSLDGQLIKEFALSKERTTIGRKPHNDIQIDNLAVSGEHAIIMTILNDSFLEDLGRYLVIFNFHSLISRCFPKISRRFTKQIL